MAEFDMEKWRGKTLTREQFQKLSAVEMAAFLESGGGGRIIENSGPTMTRAEFDKLNQRERSAFWQKNGRLTD